MKVILYVVHGSQLPEKNLRLSDLIGEITQATQDITALQEIAYLERQTDTLEVVAERLIKQGATELIVMPVLLFPALHTLVDIPAELAFLADKYPHIVTKILKNFGDEADIFDILVDKIKAISSEEVILLAHGTRHFSEPAEMLVTIAEKLSEKTGKTIRAVDYLGKKNYHDVIEKNVRRGISQTVLPFFLYEGDLIKKRVQKSIWAIDPDIPFTAPLDFDPRIVTAIAKIIRKEKQYATNFTRLT
ncbi:MAG: Cobalamin biosynthesis protein CbiX [Lactococcus sp.]|jgi:sirohydrochlorin ferrochelatase